MSQRKTITVHTTNVQGTEVLGQNIGKALKGGEVIELVSDLGGGKTALTRGIATGIGSSDRVMSPTFTISRVYSSGPLKLVHYDFYRLDDPGLLRHELEESLHDPSTITVVEWAHIVADILPQNRITITITKSGENSRSFEIKYPEELAAIFKGYN